MVSGGWETAWKWYADEVMHGKTRHCKLHIRWLQGGVGVEMHVRTHFPWLGFIKGFFAQVLVYTWFYKSEKKCRSKSIFCAYLHIFGWYLKSILLMRPLVWKRGQGAATHLHLKIPARKQPVSASTQNRHFQNENMFTDTFWGHLRLISHIVKRGIMCLL